jgi:hypothetical protein
MAGNVFKRFKTLILNSIINKKMKEVFTPRSSRAYRREQRKCRCSEELKNINFGRLRLSSISSDDDWDDESDALDRLHHENLKLKLRIRELEQEIETLKK